MKPILEICAADIDSVLAAAAGGADRIELCCALSEGGLTPSIGMIEEALRVPGIKVNVLIRPRAGDFVYSEPEILTMLRDIETCTNLGVNGVVLGALTPDGNIDVGNCRRMVNAAKGIHLTFHRAFDICRDPQLATRQIIDLGFDRVLTSGQSRNALSGAQLIQKLVNEFPEITFIAASGINPDNVSEIMDLTETEEIHASAKTLIHSSMTYRNDDVCMGADDKDEYSRSTTSEKTVRIIADIVHSKSNRQT
ncbi:MAG: copper homeostasis protein CutC [Muribaculaceae bacterium]|nr:copper homeostasis protein CutC [Muribaculaceae bacterium]